MSTDVKALERLIRKLRKEALGGAPRDGLVGAMTSIGIPNSLPSYERLNLVRLLNETIALVCGSSFRPYVDGDKLLPGQLVVLNERSHNHVGDEVEAGLYEVVYEGPDDDGDFAITTARIEPYEMSEVEGDKNWINARLFDVVEIDPPEDEEEPDIIVETAVREWSLLGLRAPLSVGQLKHALGGVDDDWTVDVADSSITFTAPEA